jgi:hypothetical protein
MTEKPRHEGETCCQIHAYVLPCPICEAANKPNQICIGYDDDQPVFVDRDSPQGALQAARNKANPALGTQEGEGIAGANVAEINTVIALLENAMPSGLTAIRGPQRNRTATMQSARL